MLAAAPIMKYADGMIKKRTFEALQLMGRSVLRPDDTWLGLKLTVNTSAAAAAKKNIITKIALPNVRQNKLRRPANMLNLA